MPGSTSPSRTRHSSSTGSASSLPLGGSATTSADDLRMPKRGLVASLLGQASTPLARTESLDDRRPSVQFLPHREKIELDAAGKAPSIRRRMSSPPPPPVFRPRVSFDTFDKAATEGDIPAFTLNQKHKDYEYSKRSRTFLCGLDANDYSEYALEWLVDELVDDGDEVVCLRVLDPQAATQASNEGVYREQAEALMKTMEAKNHEHKAVNLILEFAVGKVEKVIKRMIEFYEPAILIVGTRGRSLGGFQGLLPGSISKFCLQNSPVPVIVVRPNMQRARGKRKRLNDPARHAYRDLLDKTGPDSGHILDAEHRGSSITLGGEEIGPENPLLPRKSEAKGSPLVKVETPGEEGGSDESEVGSPEGMRVMKSPKMTGVESPEDSVSESGDDDEEEEGKGKEGLKL
ncbi:adenine nucleotide alpha hydrolases-like protein [Trichodelitschia bisporula]|uniref:Adenine nucleotide alpha hydrolases-like protein n=1 Tax=Trichodelitschia bisporula TaxID=703511 RepID=A0A6G1HRG3_9PEZI|nr:adenine nucleotide alpha hydrolases-like protein [Trichodelitschia bisporula]